MSDLSHSSPTCLPLQHRRGLFRTLRQAMAIYRERRNLRALSAQQLDDIGLCRREAEIESRRPVWDAPDRWRS